MGQCAVMTTEIAARTAQRKSASKRSILPPSVAGNSIIPLIKASREIATVKIVDGHHCLIEVRIELKLEEKKVEQ